MYDKRPAHKLATLRVLKGHRLSARDLKELRGHARYLCVHNVSDTAKLISFHKRRKRSTWLCDDGRVVVLNGKLSISYREQVA